VAISTRDRPEALARCVSSLYSGSVLPCVLGIVYQSRGSRAAQVPSPPVPARLVHVVQDETGLAVSQNEALRRAGAPVVAVIDDDCVASENWLREIEQAFDSEPALDLIAGRVVPLDSGEPDLHAVSSRTSVTRIDFDGEAPPWLVGSGNNFAVRRERFLAIGGCDTRLGPGARGLGGMDMDLFYRLLRGGARARYEPSILVYHEKKTAAERRRRRFEYGYGMGACCKLWLVSRDAYALRVLAAWAALRIGLLLGSLRRRDARGVAEELLVLTATIRGLRFRSTAKPSATQP